MAMRTVDNDDAAHPIKHGALQTAVELKLINPADIATAASPCVVWGNQIASRSLNAASSLGSQKKRVVHAAAKAIGGQKLPCIELLPLLVIESSSLTSLAITRCIT
jgi:hypothetical protein